MHKVDTSANASLGFVFNQQDTFVLLESTSKLHIEQARAIVCGVEYSRKLPKKAILFSRSCITMVYVAALPRSAFLIWGLGLCLYVSSSSLTGIDV